MVSNKSLALLTLFVLLAAVAVVVRAGPPGTEPSPTSANNDRPGGGVRRSPQRDEPLSPPLPPSGPVNVPPPPQVGPSPPPVGPTGPSIPPLGPSVPTGPSSSGYGYQGSSTYGSPKGSYSSSSYGPQRSSYQSSSGPQGSSRNENRNNGDAQWGYGPYWGYGGPGYYGGGPGYYGGGRPWGHGGWGGGWRGHHYRRHWG